jgi:uncharacterized membrane protein
MDACAGTTTRAQALSNGVFTTAMTVLMLDLRAPSHRDGTLGLTSVSR